MKILILYFNFYKKNDNKITNILNLQIINQIKMNEELIQNLGYLATKLVYEIQQTIKNFAFGESDILWLILAMEEKEEKIELFTLDSQCQNLKIFLDNIRSPSKFDSEKEIFTKVLGMVFDKIDIPKMYYEHFYDNFKIDAEIFHKSPQFMMSEYIFICDVNFEESNVVFSIIRQKY